MFNGNATLLLSFVFEYLEALVVLHKNVQIHPVWLLCSSYINFPHYNLIKPSHLIRLNVLRILNFGKMLKVNILAEQHWSAGHL